MSELFEIKTGLSIEDQFHLLTNTGAPADVHTDAAPVGSIYTNQTSGEIYTKNAIGAGTDKWILVATEDLLASTISWREPAMVIDTTSDPVPTGVAGNPVTIDGVSITDGNRVLFSGITAGDGPNVYTYDQASGLFVEDTNPETSGDTLYIESGTNGGKRYTFNGTSWVETDASSLTELQFIRTFIGKDGQGTETPTYSSAQTVTQSGDLEQAIGELDAEIGPAIVDNSLINDADSVNENIQSIADFVEDNNFEVAASSITAPLVVDTVTATYAKWVVVATASGAPANKTALEVTALHNGTVVDFTQYGFLQVGATINGLTVTPLSVSATDMSLQIQSTDTVDVTVRRITVVQ